ncbi:MAG TPA: hypothetical protein VFV87_19780, partial [Pirellulaceae bacterium]|nr:hypothetical protein [Pirellulaceae bacterium]
MLEQDDGDQQRNHEQRAKRLQPAREFRRAWYLSRSSVRPEPRREGTHRSGRDGSACQDGWNNRQPAAEHAGLWAEGQERYSQCHHNHVGGNRLPGQPSACSRG